MGYKVEDRISDNICEIYKIKVKYSFFINYCYIIRDKSTNNGILIDPAWDFEMINKIIEDELINVTCIFVTHSHMDHINLVDTFAKRYDCDVYISEVEQDYYHYNCRNMRVISDKENFKIGNLDIKFLLTPGHTKGSMCFLINNYLFTGDTVFIEGVGICDKPEDAKDLYYSVQYIKNNLDRNVLVFPGHCYGKKLGVSLDVVILNNIYFQIDDINAFVDFRMRRNQKNLLKFT